MTAIAPPLKVPDDFEVPTKAILEDRFLLLPLSADFVTEDWAVLSPSIDHIRTTPGFGDVCWDRWPPASGWDFDRNLEAIRVHEEEFVTRTGFAYSVFLAETRELVGCVYLFGPVKEGTTSDVHVRSWVGRARADLDRPLAVAVRRWLDEKWPFREVDYDARAF